HPVILIADHRPGRNRPAADIAVAACFIKDDGQFLIGLAPVPHTAVYRDDPSSDILRHKFLPSAGTPAVSICTGLSQAITLQKACILQPESFTEGCVHLMGNTT